MTFEEGPAVKITVENSLLSSHARGLVNRQVREKETNMEEEAEEAETKRHWKDNKRQEKCQSSRGVECKHRK